jgi:hypothetical protein
VAILLVGAGFLFVLPHTRISAQYPPPTPTPMPAHDCSRNAGCGLCTDGKTWVTYWNNCTIACNDPFFHGDCTPHVAPAGGCILITPACLTTCHLSQCTNVSGIPGCVNPPSNPNGNASYDDCVAPNTYECSPCSGVVPTSPPLLLKVPGPSSKTVLFFAKQPDGQHPRPCHCLPNLVEVISPAALARWAG